MVHEEAFENKSEFVPPLVPDIGFDDDNEVTGDATGDPDVKVGVTCAAVAFIFIDGFVTPVVVTVGCTAEELAPIRSESLSDKSELLEELSLMSQ